jgi:hypothetical protein
MLMNGVGRDAQHVGRRFVTQLVEPDEAEHPPHVFGGIAVLVAARELHRDGALPPVDRLELPR